ncbi:hypothetical protein B0A48_12331 [Cryoendolithus antarcticus]|uniref:DNA ligase D 3'-phosphoesterase domain-containing protein n=1 Tax=Cryoendolithus antarcticus TaxID=1507870 RepID=A0A1V8SS57_9PEZI|nr:hypothetical protein B0A48_12331 [Cryoendolithus antarcticus]
MDTLSSLSRDISPPPTRGLSRANRPGNSRQTKSSDQIAPHSTEPRSAAIEAGKARIRDHLRYFADHLLGATRPAIPTTPRLPISDFRALYTRNQHAFGHHFVIHQHDHPVSGVHYDLRLQFSESSAVSWAVPYGMPGNANSIRPNRMAIETRVHNLWNNLIESASHATGSLLIWDTGEYEVLPSRKVRRQAATDDETSDCSKSDSDSRSASKKLSASFRARHIRLRLHGTRLPPQYTVNLRLPSANNRERQPDKSKHKRRRIDAKSVRKKVTRNIETDSDDGLTEKPGTAQVEDTYESQQANQAAVASDPENDTDPEYIRATNAYPGATNTIGSVHQRHWFLTLDRPNSGFRRSTSILDKESWTGDWEPFHVLGRDVECSVITGRLAGDIMEDEGVQGFVGRHGWRGIVE